MLIPDTNRPKIHSTIAKSQTQLHLPCNSCGVVVKLLRRHLGDILLQVFVRASLVLTGPRDGVVLEVLPQDPHRHRVVRPAKP